MSLFKQLVHISKHGALFGLSKAVVLISPLLAAGSLGESMYGSVEWWIGIATSLGLVAAFGAPGILAYFSASSDSSGISETAAKYSITASGLLLLSGLAWLLWSGVPGFGVAVVLAASSVIVIQSSLSSALKASGKGAWASLAESAFFCCLFFSCAAKLLGFDFLFSFVLILTTGWTAMILVLCAATRLRPADFRHLKNTHHFFSVGARFMVASALMAFFMTLPRIVLGATSTPTEVASFALSFRWLSISIAAHQFINTVFFKRIYIDTEQSRRDHLQAIIIFLVFLACVTTVFFLSQANRFAIRFPTPKDINLLWPFTMAMILWSTTSCLEGNLQRNGQNGAQILSVSLGLSTTVLLIFILERFTPLPSTLLTVWAWVGGFSMTCSVQLFFLHRTKVVTRKLRAALLSTLTLSALFEYVLR